MRYCTRPSRGDFSVASAMSVSMLSMSACAASTAASASNYLRLGGIDRGVGSRKRGLRRGERGAGGLFGGLTVIDDLLRDGIAGQQLLRARIGLGGGIELGLALFHHRQRRGLFGFPLGDKAVGRIDCYFRTAILCFRLTLPRLQLRRIHLGEHLPAFTKSPFTHHDVVKATGGFGGNVDLDGLDRPLLATKPAGSAPPFSFDQEK